MTTSPVSPAPEDRAEAQVRAAVRAASALVRRDPTPSERAVYRQAFIAYTTTLVLGGATVFLAILSVSWGPPAPPPMPST